MNNNGGPVRVETLSELQIWIKGEFALIAQTQSTSSTDLTNVRRMVHDLNNQMTIILALNLPEKLANLQEADKVHQASIEKFSLDAAGRQSSLATIKAIYMTLGGAIATVITLGFQFYKLIH